MTLRQPLWPWVTTAMGTLPPPDRSMPVATQPGTPSGLVVDKQPPPPRATCSKSAAAVTLLPQLAADKLPFVVEPLTPVSQVRDAGGGGRSDGGSSNPAQSKGSGWPTLTDNLPHGQQQSAAATPAWWRGSWGRGSGDSGGSGGSGDSGIGGSGGSVHGAARSIPPILADDRPGDSLDWEDLEGGGSDRDAGDEDLESGSDSDGSGDGGGPRVAPVTTDVAVRLPPACGGPAAGPALPRKVEGAVGGEEEVAFADVAIVSTKTRAASTAADGKVTATAAATFVTGRGTLADEPDFRNVATAATGLGTAALRPRGRLQRQSAGPLPGGIGECGGGVTRGIAATPPDPQRRPPLPAGERLPRAHLSAPANGPDSSPPPTPTMTPPAVEAICALAAALPTSIWARATPEWRASIAVTVTALLFPATAVLRSTAAAPAAVAATPAVTTTAAATSDGTTTPVLPSLQPVLSPAVLTPFLLRTATAHGFPLVEVWLPVMVADGSAPGGGGICRRPAAAAADAKGTPNTTSTTQRGSESSSSTLSSTSKNTKDCRSPPIPSFSRRCSHLRLGWTALAPNTSPADAAVLPRYVSRSARVTFRPAFGLPGRVYVTRRPEVVGREGLTNRRVFRRASDAKAMGLGAAFAVPLLVRGGGGVEEEQVAAVLLFSRVGEPPGGAVAVATAVDEVRGWVRLLSAVTE